MSEEHRTEHVQWEVVAITGEYLCAADTPEAAIAGHRQTLLELEAGWIELERLGRTPNRKRYDVAGVRERKTVTIVTVGDIQQVPLSVPDGVRSI